MRAHIVQHVRFEGPAAIAEWLAVESAEIQFSHMYGKYDFSDPKASDIIVVMGGPMSINEVDIYPWIREELAFLRAAIDSGVRLLGVCLGAQMIAAALGSRIFPCAQKEIGWFPIRGVNGGEGVLSLPSEATVLHWHGETFDLPDGAVRLASSALCENQAFQFGERTIGLQFHLEMNPLAVGRMISNCGDDLVPAEYVQSEDEIRKLTDRHYTGANSLMGKVLDYLLK